MDRRTDRPHKTNSVFPLSGAAKKVNYEQNSKMAYFCTCVAILIGLFAGVTPAFLKPTNDQSPGTNSTEYYLEKTFDGLDKVLQFFLREYRDVNLDAVIGTRIVEASLNMLLLQLNTSNLLAQLPHSFVHNIIRLRNMAREFSEDATPYIKRNDPEYYRRIGETIARGLFDLNYDSRDVVTTQNKLWKKSFNEIMSEADSDSCLGEIFGARDGMQCATTDQCWTLMTSFGYSAYSLTHEIFYLEIAEGFGCKKEIQRQILNHRQPNLRELQDIFCANILDEANMIAEKGFPSNQRDLFMEQAALCGMLGFRQFFNNDWLIHILSWQDAEEGCYKWDAWHPENAPETSHVSRRKREEKRIFKGCLCHRSTVAAGVMAQYVRYILEVWIQENLQ
ncbi:UPF0764 protein C16orf89 homolog isoform X1 [Biomphalaria glabrata]|uniref:UPF0764 protein C16orf89 homolog isoform X1 n=3 Tax=Biomphalaria glabrata TaxID=6526 RepID=A0A9W2ZMC1_BIOGL|nr:UPF0764 protein C16orf89 homolog isoform X1 [Biomphalaria glabrata]